MAAVFSVLDTWNRQVDLDEVVWNQKIAIPKRIPRHCLYRVEETIRNPDCVTHDKVHRNRECFYKARVLPPPQG